MNNRQRVDRWLADLSAKYRLDANRLDQHGVCAFRYQNGVELVVEAPDDSALLIVWSPMCAVPKTEKEVLYRTLLELNLMAGGVQGAVFAVNPRCDEIVLNAAKPIASVDSAGFERLVADFLETARVHWERLNKIKGAALARSPGFSSTSRRKK